MSDGTGNETLSSHAYWDCSNGVSGLEILAACLGAAMDLYSNQTPEWIKDLQKLILRIFHLEPLA
jgi:hypothetical protein